MTSGTATPETQPIKEKENPMPTTNPSGPPSPNPVWSPADTAALREMADRYPREIGQSPVLDFILGREGIPL